MIEKVRVTASGKLLLCIGSGCARLKPRFCCTARTKGEGGHARRSAAHAVGDAARHLAAFLRGGDLDPRLVVARLAGGDHPRVAGLHPGIVLAARGPRLPADVSDDGPGLARPLAPRPARPPAPTGPGNPPAPLPPPPRPHPP